MNTENFLLISAHSCPCGRCAGIPVGCRNSNNGICVDGWYELPPGTSDFYAETDSSFWYWAACFADTPTVCFNSALSTRYTLDWKPCSVVDNVNCFAWKPVSCSEELNMPSYCAPCDRHEPAFNSHDHSPCMLPPLQQDIGGFDTATSASLYPTLKCLDFPPPPPPRPPQSPHPRQLVPPPTQGGPLQQRLPPPPPPPMVVPLSGKLVQFPVESADAALDSWALRLEQSSNAPMQDLLLLHLTAVAPLPLKFAPGNKV